MNNELQRMWKEAVMTYFKVLFQHLPRRTEENYKNFNQVKNNIWDLLKIKQEY
jgi:hypothetical protein